MTITQNLTCRLFEEKDLPAVLHLWERYSGWGAISAETYMQWHREGPCGSSLIVVAENENGEIVGQANLAPAPILVQGKEIMGLRMAAPILHDSVRQQHMRKKDHPVFQMIGFAFQAAWNHGYDLIYALPAAGWLPVMKLFSQLGLPEGSVATFDCFSLPLNRLLPTPETEVTVTLSNGSFGDHYDLLWQAATGMLPISAGVVRNKAWLRWKLGTSKIFEVHRKNAFIGYAAIDKKGLLVDILAASENDLREVLLAVHRYIRERRAAVIHADSIDGMYTSLMAAILNGVPLLFKNFQFAFGCYSNAHKLDPSLVQSDAWYLMPND